MPKKHGKVRQIFVANSKVTIRFEDGSNFYLHNRAGTNFNAKYAIALLQKTQKQKLIVWHPSDSHDITRVDYS